MSKSNLERISEQGGVRTREDADQVTRILFRKFLNGTLAYTVQLASINYCKECGHHELTWKDINNIPIKDHSMDSIRTAKNKARHARLNIVDMLVDNTISKEREVR